MKIKDQYLVKTKYGLNLLVLTDSGDYYQQIHQTLENQGGGISVWVVVSAAEALDLINH